MRSRQIAERLGVEEAHMLEFQQFNIVWDKKMQDYEERAAMLEEETKATRAFAAKAECSIESASKETSISLAQRRSSFGTALNGPLHKLESALGSAMNTSLVGL